MPIRWRLTVFNALVIATILTLLGVSIFFLVRDALLSGLEYTVRDRAASVARALQTGQSLSAGDVDRLTLEGVFVVVRDRDGKILARTVATGPTGGGGSGERLWRGAVANGEPVEGRLEVSPGEQGYVCTRFRSTHPTSEASPPTSTRPSPGIGNRLPAARYWARLTPYPSP